MNCDFKAGLMNLSGMLYSYFSRIYPTKFCVGNYTEDSLQRIAKSMVMSKLLKEKLVPQYKERCRKILKFHIQFYLSTQRDLRTEGKAGPP